MSVTFLFLFSFLFLKVEGTCIKTSPKVLLCVNVFRLERIYTSVTTLKLVNSFIAHQSIREHLPNLQNVVVSGGLRQDECRALQTSDYTLFGCPGKHFQFLLSEIDKL